MTLVFYLGATLSPTLIPSFRLMKSVPQTDAGVPALYLSLRRGLELHALYQQPPHPTSLSPPPAGAAGL